MAMTYQLAEYKRVVRGMETDLRLRFNLILIYKEITR
ncbi:hypothetical protein BH09BAC4_BH09BAC4_29480 [soil metagenome]